MRFCLEILFFLCLSLSLAGKASARETIDSFVADARLNKVGTMEVLETIEVDATGHRHIPLYRIIETSCRHKNQTHKHEILIKSLTDGSGKPVKYSKKLHGGAVSIRLDKRHRASSGKSKFNLKYEVRGLAGFTENHPQIVWDVTGNNWPVEIKHAEFKLHLPEGVKVASAELKAWKGEVTNNNTATIFIDSADKRLIVARADNIAPGQSLRAEVNLPIGSVTEPGFVEALNWFMQEWYLIILLPLSAVSLVLVIRITKTRFSKADDAEGEIWKAPEGLRPVEIGTLVDQSCDVSDVSVTLINLAVRGYYTVREIPASGFFALSDRDYEFKKLPAPKGDQLKEYEEIFLEAIFGSASTSYLSNIQGIFRQYLPEIRTSIYKSLVARKLLAKDPQKDRVVYGSIGMAMTVLGIAVLFLMEETSFMKSLGLGLSIAGVILSIAPSFIPLRTDKGKAVIEQIHSFAETLKTAKDRGVEEKLKEDSFLFHKLLPYAIILGVFEKWASACEEHEEVSPDWFQFYVDGPTPEFSATKFAKDVWIATKVAGLTFTAPPPRQYSSHTTGKFGVRREQDHDPSNRIS